MRELLDLFFTFMKIGAVSFGGGYAMLPVLTREFCDKRGWVSDTELNDYFAIGQVTPGLIAVNVATFLGNKRKGIFGGIVATLGLVTVPTIIITIIAAVLTNFAKIEIVKHAFAGIRVAVCVLILSAILRLWKKSVPDIPATIMCLIIFGISAFGEHIPIIGNYISPVYLVLIAAVAGIIIQSIRSSNTRKGGDGK